MALIYGVDTESTVTPIMVRDAIDRCFYEAHCAVVELPESNELERHLYCTTVLRRGFELTGGDFDSPTRDSLIQAMNYLAEYSKSFRDPLVVTQHYQEIMQLIEKI